VAENVLDVTDDTFENEVLKADLPAMVDMWAPWCGPCRMVSPTIDEVAAANAGKVRAYKLNVDDCPGTAGKFGINAIPTVLFFQDGKEIESMRLIGAQPKAVYQEAVDKLTGQ
jgi:thioredoxin 1